MKALTIIACSLALCTVSHAAALVVGGFSTARVGDSSLSVGPFAQELRAAILDDYPGSSFVGVETLTANSLSNVDYLIVGAPTFTSPIFLSSAEQIALRNYIISGGAALIFIDNDTYAGVPTSDDSNETFLDPFGIDSVGRVGSRSNATSSAPAHPVMNGPAGVAVSLGTNFGGWFENLGPNAAALAQYDANAQTAAAVIAPGALGPFSGGVVFIGDADALVDTGDGGLFSGADNATFVRNAVAYSIPEPSITAMWIAAGMLLARRRGREAGSEQW